MLNIPKSEYDVFIAYYQQTGSDFAKHLKKGLDEQGFNAFLDIEDISTLIHPETSKWSNERDSALENSKRFILIMTKGFNTRKEVVHEIKFAMKLKKERIHCKHEQLINSDLIVKIDRKSIDLSDNEYIEFSNQQDLLRKILNILSTHKKASQITSHKPPEYIPKLEITDFKMNVVNGDLRVNFDLWNKGKVIVKLSSIEGIATDKKGNEISPRAREPGDLIAIETRKPISLNFKHYSEKYEEIIIIKKHNDHIEQENFQISTYLKACALRARSKLKNELVSGKWIPKDYQKDEIIGVEKRESILQDCGYKKKLEESNPKSVLSHVGVLEVNDNLDVIEHRLKELEKLAHERIAYIPKVLDFFDTALKNDKFNHNEKILSKLINIIWLTLSIEKYYEPENYLRNVERIQGKPLKYIIEIVESLTKSRKKTDSSVLYEGIYFLRQTDKKESVDALFKLVEELSNKKYDDMKDYIRDALFKEDSELKKNQREYINDKIDNLLNHENQRIRKRAKELSV